ncbi:hypothetical protein QOZ80_9AG0690870 [Eleusine coracana subsp. coracana]|nr:hypothetical protein QOZ80_9AG0690870 [Eleusine coracana subsp. coracana]
MAALAAHRRPVIKGLSFHVESDNDYDISNCGHGHDWSKPDDDHLSIGDVMSNSATRHVEELRITAHYSQNRDSTYMILGLYILRIRALPHEALRVLHIVHSELEVASSSSGGAPSFPRLTSLHLQACEVTLRGLRDMIHGAPQLVTARFENIFFESDPYDDDDSNCDNNSNGHGYEIRGPEVSSMDVVDWKGWDNDGIELDMPKLQYFRYVGNLEYKVSMKSQQACHMTRVDLNFKDQGRKSDEHYRVSFWQFLRNFNNTKVLKLKLDFPIDHIAVADLTSLHELLGDRT